MWQKLLTEVKEGNYKSLARCISLVENEYEGYDKFLETITPSSAKIIGITGPPGAGKSTLTDALIGEILKEEKKIGVLCIDPSSPFNFGSLLGDRIRMNVWYNNPNVFIRSLATRGSVGGLHPKIIEIADIMKTADFDYIIIETVGVGQSEIEIAGLADTTIVVLVPEAGDDIQSMKAGLMEIADIFVVNKADRPGADVFEKNIKNMLATGVKSDTHEIPVLKTIANQKKGIDILLGEIKKHEHLANQPNKKISLLAEKAFYMITQQRMKNVNKTALKEKIELESKSENFNLYRFISKY